MQSIHQSCSNNDVVKIRQLLEAAPSLVSSVDKWGQTPLHIAAKCGSREAVMLLLDKGADPNLSQKLRILDGPAVDTGLTPLHQAATYDHPEIVRLLLERGADVDAKTSTGETALALARSRGNHQVRNILLANGAQFVQPAGSRRWNWGRCPFCDETKPLNAKICPHCQRAVPAEPPVTMGILLGALGGLLISILRFSGFCYTGEFDPNMLFCSAMFCGQMWIGTSVVGAILGGVIGLAIGHYRNSRLL